MAVKARETLESKQISITTLGILMVVVVGYTLLYNQFANTLEDYRLKTIVGVISLVIMMGGFLISLRYITTVYEMVITHDRLIIDRKIFFWKKTVLEVKLDQIKKIIPIEEAKKVEGQMRNYTLTNMDGKRKYMIQYEEQGKICSAKIQCSGKFHEILKKQVKI
ncbi:MAG: hypothetical protein CVV01_00130 [Firmicutes bacterium HGW-Firmicutes-6]|jgi:hypothetical protein|nr:MAG: hypothetical protein CVV01_00130 [Firmicutes bacterium HGW-Firmicutes-6]PKM52742.1 MAG: hypothetical protein CVV00_15870 [Firmicutes bacterium HGW-Firmicutes-5]PKM54876.1 MAG: hypothetical protein CVU98_12950 [Firmicutes bacterium HGW-Firmicutes-3]